MRFALGCLLGLIGGMLVAALAIVVYSVFAGGDKLSLFPEGAPAGNPDVVLTLRQEYVGAQIQKQIEAQGLGWTDLQIGVHAPNRIEASMAMSFSILGRPLTLRPHAQMRFRVEQGQVLVDMERVDVSGFQVPQEIVDRQAANFKRTAQDQLNAELRRWLQNTGLSLISADAAEGEIIVRLGR